MQILQILDYKEKLLIQDHEIFIFKVRWNKRNPYTYKDPDSTFTCG